ncbi:MAG: DegV family protein [Lachnospiraceae bacterium]|jgi:DegV family protein with EDD domain
MSFIVTTDSGCDLPLSLLSENNIYPIAFSYEAGGEIFTDTMNSDDYHSFYQRMRAGAVPKTSQLNSYAFLEFWRPLLDEMKLPIVHISLGSGVSGTWQSGVKASKELREEGGYPPVYVIDSTLCSTGYGMLALEAARMRDRGQTVLECVEWLEKNKINVNTWYTTDELLYLRRSGRCSRASAAIGTALKICPILNLDAEGHLIVQERVHGLKKTISRIHEIIGNTVVDAMKQTLYVCHSDIPEQAEEFGEALKTDLGFKDVFYTYIGTIIGANCGPGLMAAFYFGKPRNMKGYVAGA